MSKSKPKVSSFRIAPRRAKSRHRKRRGFRVEPLEDRRLLAVVAVEDPDDGSFYDATEDTTLGTTAAILIATESTWDFLDELPASGDGSYPVDDESDTWNSVAFDVADTAASSHGNWDSGDAMFVAGAMSGFPGGGNTALDGVAPNPNSVNAYLFRTTSNSTRHRPLHSMRPRPAASRRLRLPCLTTTRAFSTSTARK